jgi:predicted DNA-binding transcriptional regulator AlpA
VCSETIRRYMRDEKLPKPDVELSRRTMGWKLSTLRAAGINL